jgi:hypothetical protein
MNTKRFAVVLSVGLLVPLSGCGNHQMAASELETESMASEEGGSAAVPTPFVEREFWLALAEEPRWHLDAARGLLEDGNPALASVEVAKVAAILNFESRHSHSPREEGLLLASVEELREVARNLRLEENADGSLASLPELDRVSALVLRSVAAHQVTLARDALEDGDARMAGLLTRETAHALQAGFERSGVDPGSAVRDELREARKVGLRMQIDGEGSREEGLATLDELDATVTALGNVVTGRKR